MPKIQLNLFHVSECNKYNCEKNEGREYFDVSTQT